MKRKIVNARFATMVSEMKPSWRWYLGRSESGEVYVVANEECDAMRAAWVIAFRSDFRSFTDE